MPALQVEVAQSHVKPEPQQLVHPQSVVSGAQSGTHLPPTSCWPQPQVGGGAGGGGGGATHLPDWQLCPVGQLPLLQVPPQPSEAPHALPAQVGVQQSQTACPVSQICPVGQPLHLPPQPLSSLQVLPLQSGTQVHFPFWQTSCGPGQLPLPQMPPQPSGSPQALPSQAGLQQTQTAWPVSQTSSGAGQPLHLPPQPLSSLQVLPAQSGTQVHLLF
jgi:hypothetical protein